MNKLHVAGTGISAAFLVQGVALFFPHANITADQMAFLVGVLPSVAMIGMRLVEAVFPKAKAVVAEAEKASA